MRRTLVAAAFLALAAGCAQASDTTGVASAQGGTAALSASATPTPTIDREERGRQFAKCMRENGVDMEDPGPEGRVRIQIGKDLDEATVEKAMKACEHLSPMGDRAREMSPEDQERARQFAKCMRENGVDMPDPEFNGGAVRMRPPSGRNPDDPAFRKAMEACRDKLGPLGGPR
jgi:hypothetical protein